MKTMLTALALALPTTAFAQSGDELMRMICFDSARPNNGWAIVVSQVSNDAYSADTFIPNAQGEYAERFPMFDRIAFSISVYRNAPGFNGGDAASFTQDLVTRGPQPTPFVVEGHRVNSVLELRWGISSQMKFDSLAQEQNFYVNVEMGEDRKPVCQLPFAFTPQPSS